MLASYVIGRLNTITTAHTNGNNEKGRSCHTGAPRRACRRVGAQRGVPAAVHEAVVGLALVARLVVETNNSRIKHKGHSYDLGFLIFQIVYVYFQ